MRFEELGEADWQRRAATALSGADLQTLVSQTEDGVTYGPLHPAAPVRPILRGTLAPWSIAQRIDDPDPVRANAQALSDLEGGADALTVVLEGAPSAHGFGLPAAGIEAALAGVRLDAIHLRIEAGIDVADTAPRLAALLADRGARTAGVDLGLDPLGPLALSGEMPSDDHALRRGLGALSEDLAARPLFGRLFEADGRVYHEAGASEAQELAAVLSAAVYALRIMEAGGAPTPLSPSRIGFTLAADQKQFRTMAKFRALRLLWHRVQALCGIDRPAPARLHAETSFRMMAAADPHVNILRTTVAAFAAATGGADRITVLPFTAALGLPDAAARRLARNTQSILRDEAGLGATADPAAGAGGVAALTEGIAAAAWTEFRQIEGEGGLFASLGAGHFQRRIRTLREARAEAVADGREPIVGVTLYPVSHPPGIAVLAPRPMPPEGADGGASLALTPIRLAAAAEPQP